jgi:hypothetical protein
MDRPLHGDNIRTVQRAGAAAMRGREVATTGRRRSATTSRERHEVHDEDITSRRGRNRRPETE